MSVHSQVVLYGGKVRAFIGRAAEADAVHIAEGKVVALGSESDVLAAAPAGAQRIDVGGGTIMPGLIDTHPHLLHYGSLQQPLVDIANAANHAEIVHRIAERAGRTPEGDWVMTTPV